MRRFARVLRRFADRIDPQPRIAVVEPYTVSTTATPANVTFNWTRNAR